MMASRSVVWYLSMHQKNLPLRTHSIGMLFLGLAIISAWAKFGREIVSIVALLYAPFYILKKIPLYLSFLLKRQVDWVRSKRDES